MAAGRAGLKTVILPHRNEPDLEDVPAEIRNQLHFVFAERVDEVFAAALRDGEPARNPEATEGTAAPTSEEVNET
jgi:ATP-dependent Lon protease